MRKLAIAIAVTAFVVMSASVSAMDMKGMFNVGGITGYSIGFGDAFKDYKSEGFSSSSSLGILFGGNATYFFGPDMGVNVGATYQTWKFEWDYSTDYYFESSVSSSSAMNAGMSGSETENWIGFSANFIYFLNVAAKTMPYISGGPVLYTFSSEGSDSKIGFNAGGGVYHFFTPQAALNAGATFHMIPSAYETLTESKAITALQFFVGFSYFFGGTAN